MKNSRKGGLREGKETWEFWEGEITKWLEENPFGQRGVAGLKGVFGVVRAV